MGILYTLAAAVGLGVLWLGTNVRVVKQFERGVVFRFGRVQTGVRGPGLMMLIPIADRLEKVNMQIITMPGDLSALRLQHSRLGSVGHRQVHLRDRAH